MVWLYECLDARHGVFRGHMHVGGAAWVRMIAFACFHGGGVQVLLLHWGRLEVFFSCGWGGGGLVVSFWRGGFGSVCWRVGGTSLGLHMPQFRFLVGWRVIGLNRGPNPHICFQGSGHTA